MHGGEARNTCHKRDRKIKVNTVTKLEGCKNVRGPLPSLQKQVMVVKTTWRRSFAVVFIAPTGSGGEGDGPLTQCGWEQ